MKDFIITPSGNIKNVGEVLSIEKAKELINKSVEFIEASISGNVIEVENFYDLTKEELDKEKETIETLLDSWKDLYVTKFQVKFCC